MNPVKTHGAFSWSELMTPNPENGAAFYSSLFGWTTEVQDMGDMLYTLASMHGAPVAGIMNMMGPDIPPNWSFYVTVDDVDAIAARAAESGAKIQVPPTDIPNIGRFCGFFDPQGAFISAIKYSYPDMPSGPEPDFGKSFVTHGAFSWFELSVPDVDAAISFYQDLFGWTVEASEFPSGVYNQIKVNGIGVGGITTLAAGQNVPPHWRAYVTVDDADAIAEKVAAGGGTVIVSPTDIPQVGRFLLFTDGQGAMLAAIKYAPMNG